MAVSSVDTLSGPYTTNGVTTTFPFTFKAMAEGEVRVFRVADDEAQATIDPGAYDVTLTANGGSVIFSSAPVAGDPLYIGTDPDFTQQITFENQGAFLPEVMNEAFDRAAVKILAVKDAVDRAPQVPQTGGFVGQYPVVLGDGTWGFASGTGSDAALRADLAIPGGIALVGDGLNRALSNMTVVDKALVDDTTVLPMGNALASKARITWYAEDKYDGEREFIHNWGFNFTHGGSGDPTYQWDKCARYVGGDVGGKVKNAWISNELMGILPPAAGSTYNFLCGHELDINNVSGINFNSGNSLDAPCMYAHHINGAGTNTITAGYAIITSRAALAPLVERGFLVTYGAAKQSAFEDLGSSATSSFKASGTHVYGVDLRGGEYTTSAVCLPVNANVGSITAAGNLARMIATDDQYNMQVGDDTQHTNILMSRPVLPKTGNSLLLGSFTARWLTGFFSKINIAMGAPASSTAAGQLGDVQIDPNYIYVCTATNSWKRIALVSF